MIKVTVWNEFFHEKNNERVAAIYPNGIHGTIAEFLKCDDIQVRTATLEDEECGLTEQVLNDTDVLIWWGHMRHGDVPDEIVERIKANVLKGMGFIALHSAHHSKIFKALMGTTCNLSWREDGDLERVWTINPAHPIAQGIGRYFELNGVETYAEPFGIPEPDEVVFMGWYEGGEVFRTGCTFHWSGERPPDSWSRSTTLCTRSRGNFPNSCKNSWREQSFFWERNRCSQQHTSPGISPWCCNCCRRNSP